MIARAWQHKRSKLVTASGGSHHGAVDPVVLPGERVTVRAKFTYGVLSKDLQDEGVVLLRSTPTSAGACPAWKPAGTGRTNSDGRVAISFADGISSPGTYPFAVVVAGDGTLARGAAWALKANQRVVVFDVDGTLTQGDEALVEQLLSKTNPQPRRGAAKVANRLAAGGALIVYITGRPSLFAGMTRSWLDQHGFPLGPLRTTTRAEEATGDGVRKFKLGVLRMLQRKGARIERAYGNAVTDICAYAAAGIRPEMTFIAGRHGGESCADGPRTQALGGDYEAHFSTLVSPVSE